MSNETEQQQLWTDERIEEETERHWKAHGETYQYLWVREMMRQIRDDCLADRAALHERIAELEAYWPEASRYVIELETKVEALTAELEAAWVGSVGGSGKEGADMKRVVWSPVEGLAYSLARQTYTIKGEPIDLLDPPSDIALCRATEVDEGVPPDVPAQMAELEAENERLRGRITELLFPPQE